MGTALHSCLSRWSQSDKAQTVAGSASSLFFPTSDLTCLLPVKSVFHPGSPWLRKLDEAQALYSGEWPWALYWLVDPGQILKLFKSSLLVL